MKLLPSQIHGVGGNVNVPVSAYSSQSQSQPQPYNEIATNMNGEAGAGAVEDPPTPPDKDPAVPSALEADVEKNNSLKRSTVGSGGRAKHRTAGSLARGKGSLSETQQQQQQQGLGMERDRGRGRDVSPVGVTLEDRPMDD